jgi:hypothetical protein
VILGLLYGWGADSLSVGLSPIFPVGENDFVRKREWRKKNQVASDVQREDFFYSVMNARVSLVAVGREGGGSRRNAET